MFMLCLQVALASAWFEAVVHLAANVSLLTVLGCDPTHTLVFPPPPSHAHSGCLLLVCWDVFYPGS